MIGRFEEKPRSEPSFEEAVNIGLSRSGIGDSSNNFNGVRMSLDIEEFWPKIRAVATYEGYVRNKYEKRPDIAEAIVARTNQSFVSAYNAAVEKINLAIGTGIENEEQAKQVQSLCDDARKVVVDFCSTIEPKQI